MAESGTPPSLDAKAMPTGLREEFFMRENGLLQTDIDHSRKKKSIIDDEIGRLRSEYAVAIAEKDSEIDILSSKLEARVMLPTSRCVQLRLATEAEAAEAECRIGTETTKLYEERIAVAVRDAATLTRRLAVLSAPDPALRTAFEDIRARIEAAEAAAAAAAERETVAVKECTALEARYAELVSVAAVLQHRGAELADAAAEALRLIEGSDG